MPALAIRISIGPSASVTSAAIDVNYLSNRDVVAHRDGASAAALFDR